MNNKQRVLIIEDSRTVHAYLRAHLKDEPVELSAAHDGAQGLELARTLKPDVILLDVEMPGLDGFEVCRRLKADAATRVIPVIFLTGSSSTERKIEGLNLGAADYVTKPFDPAELRARVRGALRTKYLLDLLSQKAQLDGLTGLWNRAYLDQRLAAELSNVLRHKSVLSCVMLDVDHFKSINDRFGHPCGDEVLRLLGRILLEQCRAEDVVCRYGGEEFAILTPAVNSAGAVILAERLRVAIAAASFTHVGAALTLTCSFGVAEAADDGAGILGRADRSLYQSKFTGRNRVTVDTSRAAA